MKFGERYVYMDDLAGAAGGGAGGDPGAAAGGAGAAGAGAAGEQGAAAGAGAGAGDGGAAAGGAGSSALSGGNEWTPDAIPEKFRVKGADGELDLAATVRKVDEHRANLEKRMGAGDIRPKTPDEYKLPDTDVFKNLQLDEAGAKAFRQEAHDMGLSQKQYEAVMGKWATLAPELVNAAQKDTVDTATASLKEVWKGDFDANIRESFRVVNAVAQKAGFTYDEVEAAIGNNPVAIRLFAALGPEMREDATPNGAADAVGDGAQTYEEFIGANWAAYSDPRNPQHKAITARAAQLSARETKGQPAPR